jgi:hypothetical protein
VERTKQEQIVDIFNENTTDPRKVAARKGTVLNFEIEYPGVTLKSRRVIITLGGEDGTVDRVVLKARDGLFLVQRLAFAFREDKSSPPIAYGTRSWFSRNSILRAQSGVERDLEEVYDTLRRKVPDVVDYMNEELDALRRRLARRGRNAPHPQKLVERVRTAMIVLIDAMRLDT